MPYLLTGDLAGLSQLRLLKRKGVMPLCAKRNELLKAEIIHNGNVNGLSSKSLRRRKLMALQDKLPKRLPIFRVSARETDVQSLYEVGSADV